MKSKWKPTLMLGPLKVSSGLCRRNELMHYLHSCAHFCHTDNSTKKGIGKSTSIGMSCMKYMRSGGVALSGSGRKTWTWPAWRTWSWGNVQGQSGREELELPDAFRTLVTINRFMVSFQELYQEDVFMCILRWPEAVAQSVLWWAQFTGAFSAVLSQGCSDGYDVKSLPELTPLLWWI